MHSHTKTYENNIINAMNHEMTLGQAVGMERVRTPKSEFFAGQLLDLWLQTEDNDSEKVQNIRSLIKAVRFAHHCKNHELIAYEKFLENDNDTALQCMQIARRHLDDYNIAVNEYNSFYVSNLTGHVSRQHLCLPKNGKSRLFDLLIGEMQTGVTAHGYLKLAYTAYEKNQVRRLNQIASDLRGLYKISHYQHLSQQYPKDILETHLIKAGYELEELLDEFEEITEMQWGEEGNVCLGAINGYGTRYYD